MASDRTGINELYIPFIDKLKNASILNINNAETRQIFLLVTAMGVNSPKTPMHKKGYSPLSAWKEDDKAILSSILFGTAKDEKEINDLSDFERAINYAEICAESGLEQLKEIAESSKYDRELIERRMLTKLDDLYDSNVKGNI